MQNLELILSMLTTIVGFLTSTIAFWIKFIKSEKAKRMAENLITVKNALLDFIIEAEKFLNYTGQEKKAYVLEQVDKFAKTNNLLYDQSSIFKMIDEVVALSKWVNIKSKKQA